MKPRKLISTLMLVAAAAIYVLAGTGCKNTAHGAGQDIERMGEKVQEKTD
jgi:predicted small secreted protein